MVNLDKLRSDLEQQLSIDREIHTVDVLADTVEECLADASVQLETKVSNLEYEVIEKGYPGIMGLMKKPWKLKVYENPKFVKAKKAAADGMSSLDSMENEEVIQQQDRDGLYYIRHFGNDICLKVLLPIGTGTPVKEKEVLADSKRTDTISVDEGLIKKLCKEGTDGKYVQVGTYKHEPAGDAIMAVDISKDELSGTIIVSAPAFSGSEISSDAIKQALMTQGVVAGIMEDKIEEFVDNPVYDVAYEVAAAILPVDGRDAYIAYNFETDRSKIKLNENTQGQVDFKQLNLIQNVVAGQPLAQKMLPQRGKGGKTIMGRYLEAKNGKDIKIPMGANVKLDADGRTVVAELSGQVLLVSDKITVEPVLELPGVNIKSGNVDFMGTVIVKGNVDDGYNIKSNGNVEVYGSVGNCHIEAEGDIVISQGVMGRDEGTIKTPKTVWARFIQNTTVEAGEYVVVNDNIMNSNVTAMKKILLKGKRAQIIGGHLFATEEITAKNIGSPGGGNETLLEVGFDPKANQRLKELQELINDLTKKLEDIELNIATLENQKKIRRSLPKEKEESLKKMITDKAELSSQITEMSDEVSEIEKRRRELKVVGKVNASGTVYAGVKIFIRDERLDIKSDYKSTTFYYEGGFVQPGPYDSSSVEEVGGPSGYTSN